MAIDLGTLVPGLARLSALTRRPIPARFPLAVEDVYRTTLRRRVVDPMAQIARRRVLERLPALVPEPRADVRLDGDGDALARAVEEARDETEAEVGPEMRTAARRAVGDASSAHRQTLTTQLGARARAGQLRADPFAREPELVPVLREATRENVALIKTIPTRFFDRIEETVRDGVRRGLRHEEIAAQLERDVFSGEEGSELAIARNRAAFIARDQVGKVTAQVGEHRQRALGLTRYRWVTARDERVRGNPAGRYPDARPSHFARDGKVFSWDDAPEGGHPGEDYNCRCIAEPILDDIDDLGEERPGTFAFDPLALGRSPPRRPDTPSAPEVRPGIESRVQVLEPLLSTTYEAVDEAARAHAAIDIGRPRTVEAAGGAAEQARTILGRPVTAEQLADLAGAAGGTRVEVKTSLGEVRIKVQSVHPPVVITTTGGPARIEFDDLSVRSPVVQRFTVTRAGLAVEGHIDAQGDIRWQGGPADLRTAVEAQIRSLPYTSIRQDRTLSRTPEGKVDLHNDLFLGWPPRGGLGSKVFARQVAEARRLGVDQITTTAARREGVFNGYYTWARFGYDGPVPPDLAAEFGVTTMQELMSTEQGRAAWKARGRTWDATFDLRDGSASLTALERYLRRDR